MSGGANYHLCHRWNKQRLNKSRKRTPFTKAAIARAPCSSSLRMKLTTPENPALIPPRWLLSSQKLVVQWTAVQQHRRCSPFCVGEECEDVQVCTLRYQQTHIRMWGPAKGRKTQCVKLQIKYHFVSWALRACVILAFICVHQCHLQTQWINAAAPGTESSEPCRGYCPRVLHRCILNL